MFAIYNSDKTPTLKLSELSVVNVTDIAGGAQCDTVYEWIHQWADKNTVVLVKYTDLFDIDENKYWEIKSLGDGTNLIVDFGINSVVVVYDGDYQSLLIQHKIAVAASLWQKKISNVKLTSNYAFADKFMHKRNWGFRPDLQNGLWHVRNVRRNYFKLKGFKKHMNDLGYKIEVSVRSIQMDM